MSADNTIVVLSTKSKWKYNSNGTKWKVPERNVYRVAHIRAWDNLEWYESNEPHNLGAYLLSEFNKSQIYEKLEEALVVAATLQSCIGYVEYGIKIEVLDINLFGD